MQQLSDVRVLVAGGVGIDTIVLVPSLPVAEADSIHVPAVHDYVAHTGNGVALGLQALGHHAVLLDFIGADAQAELVHVRYRERGLEFHGVVHSSGTRRSVNLVSPDGPFLHGEFRGMYIEDCMRLGAISGAYACGVPGTAERSLSLDQLARYL